MVLPGHTRSRVSVVLLLLLRVHELTTTAAASHALVVAGTLVLLQRVEALELPVAPGVLTNVRPVVVRLVLRLHVLLVVVEPREAVAAPGMSAHVRLLSRMRALVPVKVAQLLEPLLALIVGALVGPLPGVRAQVLIEVARRPERLGAALPSALVLLGGP